MRNVDRMMLAMALAAWPLAARANGGGYSFGVQLTGSVAPFQASGTEHVRIEEEALDVALRRTDAVVTVRYTMRNVSAAPVQVRFGFPVEATRAEMGDCENDGPSACRRDDLRRSIQQLRGYTVTADGEPVQATFEIEPFATGKVKPFPGSEVLRGVGGWMVSEVTYPVGRPLTLEIRYTADHFGGEGGASDDTYVEPRRFVYRLSTGAVWSGPIGKATITVRAVGIAAEEVRVEKGKLERAGDRWVRELRNLEPTLADDLAIQAVPGFYVPGFFPPEGAKPEYSEFVFRGADPREGEGSWGGGHQRFRAKASSTLAPARDHGFGPEHLAEATPKYPWAEGAKGAGVGEWVELGVAKPRPLLALRIFGGFQGGPEAAKLYAKNGRPARVEVLLDGAHRFEATLGDVEEGQLVPIVGYAKPVSTIRITLLEVFPGARYDDTCISRIVLYDLLTKRPEIQPAR